MAFEGIKVHTRLKLFALWSSVMCFYIYGDYIELYEPGKLQEMILGRMPQKIMFSQRLSRTGKGFQTHSEQIPPSPGV
jgi:hypothetical protein